MKWSIFIDIEHIKDIWDGGSKIFLDIEHMLDAPIIVICVPTGDQNNPVKRVLGYY